MEPNDKVNILLVDDQPAKLLTYRAILEDLNENLVLAASGREALARLLKQEFAVIRRRLHARTGRVRTRGDDSVAPPI